MNTCRSSFLILVAGMVIARGNATGMEAPPPRSRAEVQAVLDRTPRPDTNAVLRPLHVLLVAGPKDHGPGEHDYPAWQRQWAALLAKAPGVRVSTAFPWPEPQQWEAVDLAVFYLKTRWDAQQLAEIRRHQARGGGVVTIHWAIGCDQDWDDHAEHFGLSYKSASYRHGPTELRLARPEHPVLLGLPGTMHFVDEPYWPFIGDRSRVQVLATSDEKINQGDDRRNNPGDDTVETVPVFWTYEPPGTGARVFVSIFGHYMWTFDDPFFRLLLLRGMCWAAKDNPYRLDPLALEGANYAHFLPNGSLSLFEPSPSGVDLVGVEVPDLRHGEGFADLGHPFLPFLLSHESDPFDLRAVRGGELDIVPHRVEVPAMEVVEVCEQPRFAL